MSKTRTLRRVAVAMMLLVAFLFQGTWALAGTTGGLTGSVTDDNGAPVAGADVRVVSAAETASSKTDNTGHFTFLSLAPDTYTVSIEKTGYNPISYAGVTVFADSSQALAFKMNKALKEIAKVSARSSGALVKAGTTSDVYSVNAATAGKVTGLGGGGSLDQAYSAIATMPGAYVPVGQGGWYQAVYIRGGDYDQVGYEVDGVPVNRSFDNYPSSTASALGQQEVQVYTGASPANSEGQGLSGYINQVIRAGTYPGFATTDLGIGTPQFYHKANVEVGGASPDRLFSYYAGFGGYNQDHRSFDQSNGAGITPMYGTPIMGCSGSVPAGENLFGTGAAVTPAAIPSCLNNGAVVPTWWALGPYQAGGITDFSDRENVVNFHFGIPHHHDGGRDDVQILYQTSDIKSFYANSAGDYGSLFKAAYGTGTACYYSGVGPCAASVTGASGAPAYPGLQFNGPLGQTFTQAGLQGAASQIVPYAFPSAGFAGNGGLIPTTARDNADNGIGIVKVQYQKNFGSTAYLRVYGYTLYSNWFNYGPNTLFQAFAGGPGFGPPFDYELETNTRGISATLADQLNPHNLLQIQGSYLTAYSLRDNNTQMYRGYTSSYPWAVEVSQANPLSGVCYSGGVATGCSPAYTLQSPSGAGGGPLPHRVRLGTGYAFANNGTPFPGSATLDGTCPTPTAPTAGCTWLTVENGAHATYNQVTPKFGSLSATDEWDPSDRLHINLGLRFDSYTFEPSATDQGAARNFWFNAWNATQCYDANNRAAGVASLSTPLAGGATDAACQAQFGAGNTDTWKAATISSHSNTQTFTVWQPRIGATFTINPTNVLRFSYGKYDQAPNTAFEQYNTLQQNLPVLFAQGAGGGFNFFAYGRNAPTYPIRPEISYNTDLSWEHQFKGTDISFKMTPFYRKTRDQIEQFFLDVATGFVSGLNVGSQTSKGLELQVQKGDFSRNGFSALLSYTYTDAKIKYSNLDSGGSVLDTVNNGIAKYNSYTKGCAGASTNKTLCGTSTGSPNAVPCFTTAGAPDPACAAGDIANPYYNDTLKNTLDTGGSYWPYDLFPATAGAGSYGTFVSPNVATLVLNYKHDKWAVTPAVQFSSGSPYGYPLATLGVDPTGGCTANGAVDLARNPGSSTTGLGYDGVVGCGGATINIPNTSGQFDNMGAFRNPNRYTGNMQVTYEFNPRVTGVLTLSNIFDVCSGGTSAAWTSVPGVAKSKVCGFGAIGGGAIGPVGNQYNNKGANVYPLQRLNQFSYGPQFGSLPFNAYFDLKIKL